MKSDRISTRLQWNMNQMFLALIVALILWSESHAYLPLQHPRIPSSTRRMTSTSSSSDNKPVVIRNKKKQSPSPGKQRYNKKYNAQMQQAIALNKQLIACESEEEILTLLAMTPHALTKMAGGGALNSVNFSTALHRLARFCSSNQETRRATLMDPRFALLLCSLAEFMVGMDSTTTSLTEWKDGVANSNKNKPLLNSRECSNIAWAIAKIRLAPPMSALPLNLSDNQTVSLVETSLKTRSQVLEGARLKQQGVWIPTLSLLSGRILDNISNQSLTWTSKLNSQEGANLLYALATVQRADASVFEHVSTNLVNNLKTLLPRPQELSNSIYSYGKAGIYGNGQQLLLQYTAQALQDHPSYMEEWKSQEISNFAWGTATILSKKALHSRSSQEDEYALQILRVIARAISERADEFKSQELANTCWSMATLGFGEQESKCQHFE
jgi:hypothetical protein